MRESTRLLLRMTALVYPTAVISGRSRADVAALLANVPLRAIVGNHGAEVGPGRPHRRLRRRVEAWFAALRDALADLGGVEIEDKGITLAVHYRRSRQRAEARRRILLAASELPLARVSSGKAVVDVCPIETPTKAAAVEDLARRFTAPLVLYVGDDVTDEDAFRSPAVRVPTRVGSSDESTARYYLASQEEVDALLEALVVGRARAAHVGAPSATVGARVAKIGRA
jgi:trehalose 6-phosphate phosphatase